MRNIIIIIIICNLNLSAQQSINPQIFGFRMSTSFIFFDIKDSSFTNKVINLKPQVLCFPGGFGNFYHLQGVGYGFDPDEILKYNKGGKANIGKSLNAISKRKGHAENYIHDFISIVKQTNASVIFNVNILNEPIADYLKVLEIFKANNINVVAVELGGELYTREYKDIIDGKAYIQLAKSCAYNIRKHYPEILIGVVAAPVNTFRRHNLWNSKLALETFYDAIIVHSYAKVTKGEAVDGKMISEKQESTDRDFSFSLYKKRAIKYFSDDYPKEIMEYSIAFNDKPIWITEWNLQMSKITANTMLQALFVSSYLLESSTNPSLINIELTTFHNMAGRTISGSMLLKKKDKMHVLSTYRPMKMLNKVFQNSDFKASKVDFEKECFKYIFTNDKKQIICWVNWSGNIHSDKIHEGVWVKEEYFGEKLHSTTLNNDRLIYNKAEVVNEINIKPFSFTMVINYE